MKYRITIEEIFTKEVEEKEWQRLYDNEPFHEIRNKDSKAEQYGYKTLVKERQTEKAIYEQTIENDKFDIKRVIDAFNS